MKELWIKYSTKIDALLPRERAMVFLAAVAIAMFMVYALFIEPEAARRKVLSARMTLQQTEMQALQMKSQAMRNLRVDPDAANQARGEVLKRQITEIDGTLKDMQRSLVPAQSMKTVLQEVLARNPRLHLIAMHTLPAAPLVEKNEKAEKPNVPAVPAARPQDKPSSGASNVFKHGVQITLQGSYTDLHDYLARLEKQPWRMFWARASLNAEDYPRLTLTVTIYTLSLDKAWLEV
jgi:MSHA biogenesis protein MshJ